MMGNVILKARNIVKSFGGNRVLDGVSFDLHEGEIVLLRGANGSGKTTLINVLTGNLEPDAGEICICNGRKLELRFPRPWYLRTITFPRFSPEITAMAGLGRVWQDVRVFPSLTSLDNVAAAAPRQLGESVIPSVAAPLLVDRKEKKNRGEAMELLKALGAEGLTNLSAGEVSFGQSKKIAIARALHGKAKVLFLDEPLAGLDKSESDNTISILKKLSSSFEITMVIVEHDLNIPRIKEIATTFWNLRDGKLSTGESNENMMPPNTELTDWLETLGDCRETAVAGGMLRIVRRKNDGREILAAESVTIKRNGRTVIEEPLSFSLHQGDVAVLQAPNGWGKSTLLEAIAGLLPLNGGKVLIRGEDVSNCPIWSRAG
ncbi:MAG: ATP-binding cassette domain-containing protein, partial [Lentisphaeria bacterium]|nr:ATP-binding cassette domain-containing protein [Lentisphaeria bacterium]